MSTDSAGAAEGETLYRSAFEGFDPTGSLATTQVEEMVAAWRRGERPTAEDYLTRNPSLDTEATIRLIFEEFCLRREAGMAVEPAEFARRYPRWQEELEILLDCHELMDTGTLPVAMPQAGEALAEFHLLAELGRGVSGRVFLATQPALADRPVVLKVTPRGREEHLSLARLQHMNIVPLHSAQVLHDRHLQVLCMPFLGGATLAQVLELLDRQPASRRSGRQLIDALDGIQARLPVALPVRGPFRRYIGGADYVEAICWIGVCLADGLQYAHDRNFVHMDIKPSNVLLAGDGQPMLLDFHLAREPITPGDPPPPWMGGTPNYMAPEQAAALAAVRAGRPVEAAVDGRTDSYGLGLLLYEALGGTAPSALGGQRPTLRACNPRVSAGLSDIIHKCLQPDPADRYSSAGALATDLRRHLDDLPLDGVPNRSLAERWRKWRGRRPHALSSTVIALVSVMTALAAIVLLWAMFRQRVHEVENQLAESRAYLDRQQYAEGARALKHGLALAGRLPTLGPLRDELSTELERTQRDARAADLHHLAELIRYRYGIDPPPPDEAHALVSRGREIWQARHMLLRPIHGRPEPQVEQMVRTDLLDFALVWASLRVQSAPAREGPEARREAIAMLDEAAVLLGPNPALDRDRQVYNERRKETPNAERAAYQPHSAWDHYDMGRSYLRSGETVLAAEQFEHGLRQRPQDFWLNFYQGLCAYRLRLFEEAASSFRVCIALAPERGECYYNHALALAALDRPEEAIADYTRALELSPTLTAAALNRGILHLQGGRHSDALADFQRALAKATGRRELGMIHYNLALLEAALGDKPAALANLEEAARFGHEDPRGLAKILRKSLDGRSGTVRRP